MNAKQLLAAGKLGEALKSIGAEVRDNPQDAQRRIFLFELLCFAGEFERAEKHLAVLAGGGPQSELGVLLYRGVLQAERTRQQLFSKAEYPEPPEDGHVSGCLNGKTFAALEDADPRIGPRLEVFAAGAYIWIPFAHITSIEAAPPRRLRDLLWIPATVRTGPAFRGKELGEVLIPVLSPFSWRHPDDEVKLGRASVWEEEDGAAVPYGQKALLVDGEEVPILEVRNLVIE